MLKWSNIRLILLINLFKKYHSHSNFRPLFFSCMYFVNVSSTCMKKKGWTTTIQAFTGN